MDGVFGLDLVSTGLRTLAMLFVVLGLLVLSLYVMKKYLSPKKKSKGDLFIEVLSTLYLSPKEKVEVIEVSGERIVLGVTPGRINFLTKLNNLNDSDKDIRGERNNGDFKEE